MTAPRQGDVLISNPSPLTGERELYDLATVHTIVHWLIQRTGKARMVMTKTVLDLDGNVFGRPLVYSGTLKQVTPPEVDSESSDAALIALEMTPAGTVT